MLTDIQNTGGNGAIDITNSHDITVKLTKPLSAALVETLVWQFTHTIRPPQDVIAGPRVRPGASEATRTRCWFRSCRFSITWEECTSRVHAADIGGLSAHKATWQTF